MYVKSCKFQAKIMMRWIKPMNEGLTRHQRRHRHNIKQSRPKHGQTESFRDKMRIAYSAAADSPARPRPRSRPSPVVLRGEGGQGRAGGNARLVEDLGDEHGEVVGREGKGVEVKGAQVAAGAQPLRVRAAEGRPRAVGLPRAGGCAAGNGGRRV